MANTPPTMAVPIIIGKYSFTVLFCYWRRGRDSNPRWLLHHNGFQDRRDRPLCHPSDFGFGRAGGTRTPNRRFWRPLLYQLSYRPTPNGHFTTSLTRPAPMVRPP